MIPSITDHIQCFAFNNACLTHSDRFLERKGKRLRAWQMHTSAYGSVLWIWMSSVVDVPGELGWELVLWGVPWSPSVLCFPPSAWNLVAAFDMAPGTCLFGAWWQLWKGNTFFLVPWVSCCVMNEGKQLYPEIGTENQSPALVLHFI